MPRPTNPHDLIHSPGGHFPYVSWEDHARTYRRFRVLGYNEFRQGVGNNDYSAVEDYALLEKAKEIVKKEWGAYLPPTSSNKDGIDKLGKNQIRSVRQHQPVAFQSACVAIVTLELALKGAGSMIDIYVDSPGDPHRIAICPAIFQVDDYDQKFYQSKILGNATERAALVKATLQSQSYGKSPTDSVFLELANGYLVTEWLASKFLDFWRPKSTLATISVCRPRTGNKFRKPSALEVQVFPLA
jgi:hypothetical protein